LPRKKYNFLKDKKMALSVDIIKKTTIYSAIAGAGFAIFALIPPLMPSISLFILPFVSGIIILTALKVLNPDTIRPLVMKDFAILGGISGMLCCASFLIIFAPMVLLVKFFIKTYYTYGIDFLNFFLAVVLIFSIMLIFFATNAVGGLFAGFLINWFDKNQLKKL